jgi:uncharacterized protein with PIN domain
MPKPSAQTSVKFAADRMLGRLTRWLRILGADVIADKACDGPALLARSRREGRIMITRDKRLRTAADVLWLASDDLREQLATVLTQWPFDPGARLFTRCSQCNTPIESVDRFAVANRVPPYVYASQELFAQCPGCGRIYWNATHRERMLATLAQFKIAGLAPLRREIPAVVSKE